MIYTPGPLRYNKMTYKRSGNSGIQLPAISLGLWHNFGGTHPYKTAREMVISAFDLGITHFDLANNYGPPPGSAEETFGYILKNDLALYRDELIISSKAGYYMWNGPYGEWGSRKSLIASCNQSLKRLGVDYLDIFYSHRYDPETPLEETMGALDYIVRSGRALYVGISNYDAEQTQKAVEILNDLGTPCLIHQARYSMFDRWVENGLLETLDKTGTGCIVFSPLEQGLLTNKYLDGIPEGSRAASESPFLHPEHLTEKRLAQIQELNHIAQERGQSLAQLALVWVLRNKEVTSALVGASSVKQIEDNVRALNNLELSNEELQKIEEILN